MFLFMKYFFVLLFFWWPASAQKPAVAVNWSSAGNIFGPVPKAAAVLTVVQKGAGRLPAAGWKIYFNSGRSVDTASQEGELRIRHINGDLFCMEPVGRRPSSGGSGSGASTAVVDGAGHELRVRYVMSDLSMNISDVPNGFFWVWDNAPDRGYPLTDYVVGRIDDENIKPVTAAVEYEHNLRIKDIPGERLPLVFPTPVAAQMVPGHLRLGTVPVIASDTLFRREAEYLAEALAPIVGRRPRVIMRGSGAPGRTMESGREKPAGSVESGRVVIVLGSVDMDSAGYTLHIGADGVRIMANSAEGIFYGVQSLLGMIGPGATLPLVDVQDKPRFAYRGLMIDVARNFRGPRELRRILDLMAFCKLNVLHLHLTDDEGWRLAIPGLPELAAVGGRRGWPDKGMLPPSFGSGPVAGLSPGSGYYARDTFVDLLRYARERHIRVIPEIECPGHARAAIRAMDVRYERLAGVGSAEAAEYLLRDTLDRSVYEGSQNWKDNVVCPGLPSVYRFMDKVVTEIVAMYHDADAPLNTIHFGGDEVPSGTWEGSPACRELMAGAPMVSGGNAVVKHDAAELRRYCWTVFYSRLDSLLARHGLELSAWEEAALPGKNFNLYVWDNMIGGGNEDLPYRLANAGHKVVLACVSNNYYDLAYERTFDEPGYHWAGFLDMERPFSFIPYDYYRNSTADWKGDPVLPGYFNTKEKLSFGGRQNILGIEGLLWAENMISDQLEEYMLLPKMLGTAERAWAADPVWGTGVDTIGHITLAGSAGEGMTAVGAGASYDSAWNLFVNNCGKRLLPRLSRLGGGYAYRIPAPGVLCRDGRVWANCSLPGFTIRYTTDGSEPTIKSPRYLAPLVYKSGLRMRVFDGRGRGGRTVIANREAGGAASLIDQNKPL
jgi:hexosaminidase